MAAASARGSSGPITGINVTPLVDVALVLLVVFMITAKLIVNQEALRVDLPSAVTGQQTRATFNVALSQDGRIELDGAWLSTDDDIAPRAALALRENPAIRAVIRADAAVPHGRVIHVLDVLREVGISRIAFGVAPKPRDSDKASRRR
jgi:biopolymer transport protein ExbD